MALGWRGQYLRYKEYFLNIMVLYKKRNDLRMFLEVILSLVTVIIFSLFALRPTALTIIALLKEIKEKEETVSALDQKITNLDEARNIFLQDESIIPIIESSIPGSAQPEIFVKQIEGIANKNSVKVLGVSVGEITLLGEDTKKKKSTELTPLPSGSKEMPVSISANGNYFNLLSFVKDLENLRRPIKIDSFGINVSSTQEGRILVAVVSGRVPFLEQQKNER